MYRQRSTIVTYGHSQLKTGHPVRSAIYKQLNGRLVLRWVTTWESLLLYVLSFNSPMFFFFVTLPLLMFSLLLCSKILRAALRSVRVTRNGAASRQGLLSGELRSERLL
jgi:hypothetical protein